MERNGRNSMITVVVNDNSKTFLNITKISKKFKIFKFALIAETVGPTPTGLLHAKLQILKF